MKLEYLRPGSRTHVLGAGGYWIDNDDHPNLQYTGLWSGDKVVALVVGADEDLMTDYVFDTCDEICGRFNAHSTLVQALVQAELALSRSVNAVSADEQRDALAAVREALLVADRS